MVFHTGRSCTYKTVGALDILVTFPLRSVKQWIKQLMTITPTKQYVLNGCITGPDGTVVMSSAN